MKKKTLITLSIAAVVIVSGYGGMNANKKVGINKLLMENVEALSGKSEDDDCNYKNGYTAFTGKKGSAYDCCKVWVENAPKSEHCR